MHRNRERYDQNHKTRKEIAKYVEVNEPLKARKASVKIEKFVPSKKMKRPVRDIYAAVVAFWMIEKNVSTDTF